MQRGLLMLGMLCVCCGLCWAQEKPKEKQVVDVKEIQALIKQLGSSSFKLREEASKALLQIGPPALPLLKKALTAKDLEVRARAKALLASIDVVVTDTGYYKARASATRAVLLKTYGGGRDTEKAVKAALVWLAKHQSASGRWDGDGFQAQCKKNPCPGVARLGWVDPGLTGLALLAFLARGDSHRAGTHKNTIKKGVRYLMKIQSADGLIGGKRGHYMYNHAICTLALVEVYGLSKSPLVKGAAQKAANWLVNAQNPGMAWRYHSRDGDNDVSVTSWCVMAIKGAKAAGLDVRGVSRSIKSARTYLDSVTDTTNYISGYRKRPPRGWQGPTSARFVAEDLGVNTANTHSANHLPTAVAATVRVFTGVKKDSPWLVGSAKVLGSMLPMWNKGGSGKLNQVDSYYWYYGTLAMFQIGGDYWIQWNKALKLALLGRQRVGGDESGSWDPLGAWGFAGGRVYMTAINALSLQVYYRYPKLRR